MNKPCEIGGVRLIEQNVHRDCRGMFEEIFNLNGNGLTYRLPLMVQTNLSRSHRGVLRGMHLQRVHSQGKLLRVLEGAIWDAWVDMRPESPTFGRWDYHVLDHDTPEQLYLPPGLAHGFLCLSANATLLYHCTDSYKPDLDGGILWNDEEVGIQWPVSAAGGKLILSKKDSELPGFRDYQTRLM